MQKTYKILIYGAGVIGSIYAMKLANAGFNVAVYARGSRLQVLQENGLLYLESGVVKKASVKILSEVAFNDVYDYIFVTVKHCQMEKALQELTKNKSLNIVTMTNTSNGYQRWIDIIGDNKLIPAFPGAGGKIENNVLIYQITSKLVQPTTFGELNGEKTHRIHSLNKILRLSKIPCNISENMDVWQKCHLAMVIPLANGIYFDGGDNYTTSRNKKACCFMSGALKKNFDAIKDIGLPITPIKLNVFRILPQWLISFVLCHVYNTKFAETLINSHAQNARDEMEELNEEFDAFINNYNFH